MTKIQFTYKQVKGRNFKVNELNALIPQVFRKNYKKAKAPMHTFMDKSNFVHLHLHTQFSLLDGCTRIEKVVQVAKEYNMPAIAITDHGNNFGTITFYDACKAKGIRPIIGCEFYVADDLLVKSGKQKLEHLIILVKNEKGYLNLCKLNSIAFRDGFYYKPRIDYKTLEQYHEGLICTSACLAGTVPQLIIKGQYAEAEQQVMWFKKVFGEDFYLELQMHRPDNPAELTDKYRIYIEEQTLVNQKLREFSKKHNIKTVATNDVHYIYKQDAELQDVLMCISMQKTIDDQDRLKMDGSEYYFKNRAEMEKALPDDIDAIENTIEIACKCNFDFTLAESQHLDAKKYHFPNYQPPNGKSCDEYLRQVLEEGIINRYGHETPQIRERVETEMHVITKLGFSQYFLTVRDYIVAAHKMGVEVGQGRGSGAGSIVAYCINITDIDPLKYDLLFERFLNLERVTAPDFDIDFSDDGREKVIEYVKQKYGEDKVVNILTFNTLAAKMAIKDVGRVLRVPYTETDRVTKLIPNLDSKHNDVLKKCFGFYHNSDDPTNYAVPELVEIYNTNPEMRRVIDISMKLEGMPRNCGTHPCGVLIGFDTLDKYIPLGRNGDLITTQYSMSDIERLGHLKMDFLGLRNLHDIKLAEELVKQNYNIPEIDFNKLGYEDPKVYDLISSGNTTAVFQLESGGFQKFLKDLKPNCLEDIIAAVALYRPGPMDSIPMFVHNKHNPQDIKYAHPLLKDILDITYGCIVYQEQVQRICQALAGYTLGQADRIRKLMSKKKKDEMAAEAKIFVYGQPPVNGKRGIPGAIKMGVPKEVAENLWANIEKFAGYAFNKAHAACYAVLAYKTAYLKTYYEPEFLTAVINNRLMFSEEVSHYVSYARSENINILPPDINISNTKFSVKGRDMRFGLCAIKGIGEGVCDDIVAERQKNGPYKSLENFLVRTSDMQINKRVIEGMIYSGAFDCFKVTRSQMIAVYETAMACAQRERQSKLAGQFSLFTDVLSPEESIKIEYPNIAEYDLKTKLKKEKEALGIYISGHPMQDNMELCKTFTFNSSMLDSTSTDDQLDDDYDGEISPSAGLEDGTKVFCGGIINKIMRKSSRDGRTFCILEVEDLYGIFSVMVFAKQYEQIRSHLEEDKIVTINGRYSVRVGQQPIIIAEKISFFGEEDTSYAPVITPVEKIVIGETQEHSRTKVYLNFDINNPRIAKVVDEILSSYDGTSQVFVQSDNKLYKMDKMVSVTPALESELKALLGEKNILVKER